MSHYHVPSSRRDSPKIRAPTELAPVVALTSGYSRHSAGGSSEALSRRRARREKLREFSRQREHASERLAKLRLEFAEFREVKGFGVALTDNHEYALLRRRLLQAL